MGFFLDGTRRLNGAARSGYLRCNGRFSRNIERDRNSTRIEGNTVSFSGSTISDSGNGLAGFIVGIPVLISGATNNGNNGKFLPATVAAGSIDITGSLVTETAGANVEIRIS